MEKVCARRVLAENLRIMRLVRKLSQEALAELAGLDRSYVSSIERGKRNLSLDKVEKLAQALDVSIPELLKEADHLEVGSQVLESVRDAVGAHSRRSK